WKKLNPNQEVQQAILKAISWQRETERWCDKNGRFVPCLSNYLADRRWEDEPPKGESNGSHSGTRDAAAHNGRKSGHTDARKYASPKPSPDFAGNGEGKSSVG